jgi:hypothetical protein
MNTEEFGLIFRFITSYGLFFWSLSLYKKDIHAASFVLLMAIFFKMKLI